MEGYLEIRKKTDAVFGFENFKKRYFILNNGILKFLKKKGASFLGQIHLSIAKIESSPEKPNEFNINTGTQEYELKSENKVLIRQWYNAM
jgi:hypothetical protein